MTLPFRRRHNDAEDTHERARALSSRRFLEPLGADEETWLSRHLDACTECRRDDTAYAADRELLRSLREKPIEPPRDLWARTSAALDREAQRRGGVAAPGAARRPATRTGWQALPLGAIAGVLVVAVLVGSRLFDRAIPFESAAPGTNVANGPTTGPTGLAVPDADPVAIFRETAAGSWELVYEEVKHYCVRSSRDCVPKSGGKGQSIDLGGAPADVALGDDQLAIVSEPEDGSGGDVLVVPVDGPGATPRPSDGANESPTVPPPTGQSPGIPSASPGATPDGAVAIASGVHVVGDVAYSQDGRWLAFSAAPADGSTGPDLYVWSVGDEAATVVTTDHQTYFASWHGGRILASRVEVPGDPTASPDPDGSPAPDESAKPGRGNGNNEGGKARATATPAPPTPTGDAAPSGSAAPAPVEGHPVSFLLDPRSLERTDLTRPDVWLPVLDPSGRNVVYWSGTLRSDDDGDTWALGAGDLVLDRWSNGQTAPASSAGSTQRTADASDAPSPAPAPLGPAGLATTLVPGAKATFEASFDPDGARLAIWYSENLEEAVGRLHLLVIDPATGTVDSDSPLQGAAALRRFTIDTGRLAWVTPSGQNGKESLVQVLGWKGDDFGEIETEPASDLYLP